MTFPALLTATESVISGAAALIVGVVLAFRGKSLVVVSVACCAAVFVTEQILRFVL